MLEEIMFYLMVAAYFSFRYWLHIDTKQHLATHIMDLRCEMSSIKKEINQMSYDFRYDFRIDKAEKSEKPKQAPKKVKAV